MSSRTSVKIFIDCPCCAVLRWSRRCRNHITGPPMRATAMGTSIASNDHSSSSRLAIFFAAPPAASPVSAPPMENERGDRTSMKARSSGAASSG